MGLVEKCKASYGQGRVFNRVLGLVMAEIFAFGRHTITQLLCVLGLTTEDWSAWYRVFSEGRFDEEQTSAVMVRNSFGAVIVILLLLIGAGPIIHYGSLSLVYRFLAAIAQPISDKRVVGALSTMGEGCAMLLKLLLTAEVLCMLTFLIVVVSVS